ncbi:hypothetical protein IGI04_001292, partial [Brassica rapa subsp. trilocularis]
NDSLPLLLGEWLQISSYASLSYATPLSPAMVIKPLGSEVSPVDGTALSFGELKESRGMIEQVKGHFYSVPALLGTNSLLPMDESEEESVADKGDKSWLKVSLASLKLRASQLGHPMKGLYYCVIYLIPGDYHRIHSPADWIALVRTHFAGRLFLNECATRNIKNLYVENERGYGNKVLWYLLLLVRPTLDPLKQISKRKKLFPTEPPEEQVYDPQGHGVKLEKGKEVGVFNMGSTVVLVFQEPTANSPDGSSSSSDYRFYVKLCLLMTIPRRTCWQAMLLSCSSKTYNFTPNYGTFTMSATSKDVLKAATQLHKRHGRLHNHLLLGSNPMDGATKGMDVDQPTQPRFGDEEKSRKRPWSDCWKYYTSSFPSSFLFLHYRLYAITLFRFIILYSKLST